MQCSEPSSWSNAELTLEALKPLLGPLASCQKVHVQLQTQGWQTTQLRVATSDTTAAGVVVGWRNEQCGRSA